MFLILLLLFGEKTVPKTTLNAVVGAWCCLYYLFAFWVTIIIIHQGTLLSIAPFASLFIRLTFLIFFPFYAFLSTMVVRHSLFLLFKHFYEENNQIPSSSLSQMQTLNMAKKPNFNHIIWNGCVVLVNIITFSNDLKIALLGAFEWILLFLFQHIIFIYRLCVAMSNQKADDLEFMGGNYS